MRAVEEILAEDRLWKAGDVARYLGMSTSWVYKRVEDGTLPVVVLGGVRVRFDPAAIKAYVKSCSRGASTPASVVSLSTRRG